MDLLKCDTTNPEIAEALGADLMTAEAIHQAALSVGAKIIQQTLVDFMR